ncbi:MAG TPA: rod shape-determining protein MreD [Anaerolineae bacterium]|nr:rod shape-determining protein MreD [Anaerolineae bacterium]
MNPYIAVPFLLVISLVQATLAPHMQIGAVWPDFLLLVVMSWALRRRPNEALAWAFVGGLSVDLVSGGPFGGTALGLMTVALLASALADGTLRGRMILPIVAALAGTLAFHAVYLLAMLLVGQRADVLDALVRIALPAAVYNAALSLLLYRIMSGIDARIRPKALRW